MTTPSKQTKSMARNIARARANPKRDIPSSVFRRVVGELIGGHLRISKEATEMLHAESEGYLTSRFVAARMVAENAHRDTVAVQDMRTAAQVLAMYPCDNSSRPC